MPSASVIAVKLSSAGPPASVTVTPASPSPSMITWPSTAEVRMKWPVKSALPTSPTSTSTSTLTVSKETSSGKSEIVTV